LKYTAVAEEEAESKVLVVLVHLVVQEAEVVE
jgi:hypothetical protein